jgi:hypothetical protein
MNTFPKTAAGAIAGLALAVGAGLALAAPAGAATLCNTNGYCVTGNGYYNSDTRPSRYACDAYGEDCHWTRNYYNDEDGTPVYDPGMNGYP